MKKFYYLALVALVGLAFSSCSLLNGDKDPQFKLSDLQGLWQNNNTTTWHIRFTTERTNDPEYPFYGYEWGDFGDDVTEQEVINDRYGNGWFMYQFEVSTRGLHEVHLMNSQGAEIPKFYYVVSKLTDTDLEYYDKEHPALKYSFSKVVEAK